MKVLIWDKDLTLKNVGGPAGYLYNIHEYLKTYACDNIDFYSDIIGTSISDNEFHESIYRKIRRQMLFSILKIKFFAFIIELKHFYFTRKKLSNTEKELLGKYDYVHVHTMMSLVHYFMGEHTNVKVIFTTHCPEPCIDELSNNYGMSFFLNHIPYFRRIFLRRECRIIRNADLIMYPVKEAKEPYTIKSNEYIKLFNEIEDRIFYVPTSLYPASKIETTSNPLENEKIPEGSLKVCYIGRHNSIKGYDIVRDIAQMVWRDFDENIHFIIGGKEGPLFGLNDCRWHELGWVETVKVLNNVDLFILPNRQTYFDLILLEVLRQGKPCIISDTGGNRWFKKYNLEGVRFFNHRKIETFLPELNYFAEAKRQDRLKEFEQGIKIFFFNHFTTQIYIEHYLKELSRFEK